MWEINQKGATRIVILTKNYAFKIPNFRYEWRHFLKGLIANGEEVIWYKYAPLKLCPIVFSFPLGFLVVMKRVRVMNEEEFLTFDFQIWEKEAGFSVERKPDSYGWLNGQVVAVDYGN